MDWGYDGGGVLMGLAMLLGVLLLASAFVLAIVIYGRDGQSGGQAPAAEAQRTSAERELEMRFARGEIDAESLAKGRAALRQR